MPYTLNGQPVTGDFETGDVRYPANVLGLWSREDLEAIGLVWVEPPAPTFSEAKASKSAAVTARREAVFAAGFTPSTGPLAGHTLQVRNEADRINWLTSATSYGAAIAAGAGGVVGATFRTADNQTVQVAYAQGYQVIVQQMAAWGQAIMARSWALKDEIDAAETDEDLEAIDIESGWPE